MNYIIFTDVDGTLVDHYTYSFDDALIVISQLKFLKIPIILNTSKTFYETVELQRRLRISDPFVVENGGGIFIPSDLDLNLEDYEFESFNDYKVLILGKTYEEIRGFLESYRDRYNLKGFGDMDISEIMERTSMDGERAKLSKKRMFSEPIIFESDKDLDEFKRICHREGFKLLKGGRFYHIVHHKQSKGRAVEILKDIYEKTFKRKFTSIGLGDGKNDEDMLRKVDIPVLIPNPSYGYADMSIEGLIKAKCFGSKGWAETLRKILGL